MLYETAFTTVDKSILHIIEDNRSILDLDQVIYLTFLISKYVHEASPNLLSSCFS